MLSTSFLFFGHACKALLVVLAVTILMFVKLCCLLLYVWFVALSFQQCAFLFLASCSIPFAPRSSAHAKKVLRSCWEWENLKPFENVGWDVNCWWLVGKCEASLAMLGFPGKMQTNGLVRWRTFWKVAFLVCNHACWDLNRNTCSLHSVHRFLRKMNISVALCSFRHCLGKAKLSSDVRVKQWS
jgi:hypothetical protein